MSLLLDLTHLRRLYKSRRTQIYVRPPAKNQYPPSTPSIWLTIVTAIAVACRDVDVRHVKAMIVGPPDTPYEFGFFDVRDQLSIYSTIEANAELLV